MRSRPAPDAPPRSACRDRPPDRTGAAPRQGARKDRPRGDRSETSLGRAPAPARGGGATAYGRRRLGLRPLSTILTVANVIAWTRPRQWRSRVWYVSPAACV